MGTKSLFDMFQGFEAMQQVFATDPITGFARIGLIFLGFLLVYLGKKGILEPLLMIPMGLGMSTINASMMLFDPLNQANPTRKAGSLFLDALQSDNNSLMTIMQIDWLQPIYTLMFSNGLIACLVFLGIGSLLDVGFVMVRPYTSMFIALCAEFGTIITLPIAHAFGFTLKESAAIAMVGGADGPMVLFTSLQLAKELFVPISVVAYLYLGLAYGGYPYLIRLMVPKKLRSIPMPVTAKDKEITSGQKLVFAIVGCTLLCFLFPVAAPLFFSLFLGIAIRESALKEYQQLASNTILYSATLMLGLLLGILCEAGTIFDNRVLPLLLLGMLSLLLSGVGGIAGGYILYFCSRGKYNPVIGIAGVSCVPSTAKVAQKCVSKDNPNAIIMQYALGANISGVITTAIIAAIYIALFK